MKPERLPQFANAFRQYCCPEFTTSEYATSTTRRLNLQHRVNRREQPPYAANFAPKAMDLYISSAAIPLGRLLE